MKRFESGGDKLSRQWKVLVNAATMVGGRGVVLGGLRVPLVILMARHPGRWHEKIKKFGILGIARNCIKNFFTG